MLRLLLYAILSPSPAAGNSIHGCHSFVKTHGKTYTSDEFFPRYSIFKANVNKIRAVN